ncbi:hypothetical protein AK812_SmicGene1965 [Symbiodinium microadriaticum]|uniref:Uncharacterized protein n=1 Tax=Symbiodinium microadriaticum TaxID=2951 RepID=A0A1Q9F2S5_SYMMI|nr:hypothetical protein AK812_SmicGene1965 [Symbiodinium microadriaticum]
MLRLSCSTFSGDLRHRHCPGPRPWEALGSEFRIPGRELCCDLLHLRESRAMIVLDMLRASADVKLDYSTTGRSIMTAPKAAAGLGWTGLGWAALLGWAELLGIAGWPRLLDGAGLELGWAGLGHAGLGSKEQAKPNDVVIAAL